MIVRTFLPALILSCIASSALAIPIGGPYGTVAICIIDTLTDAPLPVVQFDFAGAPVARVTTDGLETSKLSCSFQHVLRQSGSAAAPIWAVSAQCDSGSGMAPRTLTISRDAGGTLTVNGPDGKTIVAVDACRLPYADRAARELQRMSEGRKAP